MSSIAVNWPVTEIGPFFNCFFKTIINSSISIVIYTFDIMRFFWMPYEVNVHLENFLKQVKTPDVSLKPWKTSRCLFDKFATSFVTFLQMSDFTISINF